MSFCNYNDSNDGGLCAGAGGYQITDATHPASGRERGYDFLCCLSRVNGRKQAASSRSACRTFHH